MPLTDSAKSILGQLRNLLSGDTDELTQRDTGGSPEDTGERSVRADSTPSSDAN